MVRASTVRRYGGKTHVSLPDEGKLCAVRWRKLSEEVTELRHRRLVTRTFELPDGRTIDYEIWAELDTVAVLALTPDREVVLARQFRPGPEEVLLELPGGRIEPGQAPIDAARAELLEETGYAGELEAVGSLLPDAYTAATKYVFAAIDCRRERDPEPDEFTEPVLLSLEDFRTHLRKGRLTDTGPAYRALDFLNLL
jgi:ADP-ribose pyrophosphatase